MWYNMGIILILFVKIRVYWLCRGNSSYTDTEEYVFIQEIFLCISNQKKISAMFIADVRRFLLYS
jgi:hypothetical protein